MCTVVLVLAAVLLLGGCAARAPVPDAVVTGVALTSERVVLPPEAVFEATLLDLTQPDTPPVVLGRQRSEPSGQPPFAVHIPYPTSRFVPKGRYEVRASVSLDGRILWATEQRFPVPQDAAYRHVTVRLHRMLPQAATVEAGVPLLWTHWRLVEIEGEAVARPAEGAVGPHLVLQADEGRAAGSGGCNRFLADYAVQPGGRLRFRSVTSNITLCLDRGALEARFFRALEAVESYRQQDAHLLLRDSEGEPLLRFEAAVTLMD